MILEDHPTGLPTMERSTKMLEKRNLECVYLPTTHEYFDLYGKEYPSATRILNHAELCDFSLVPEYLRQRGLSRGTAVHWMTLLEDQGALNYRKLSKSMRGYRKAWNTFKSATGFVSIERETPFIDSRGFGGTPDCRGTFPPTLQIPYRSLAIVDIKTGHAVMDWVRYQLSFYTSHFGGVRSLRRVGVALHEDGTYKVREFPMDTALHDFAVAMKALEKWRKDNADRTTA